ncbi:uncharacterized protein [Nicotiana sylvestris]|uniref:uncharacterized protein n=1 Tax=Nicotiana sylvestris TaxID=4096 RepID=UPI00388CB39D
MGILTHLALQRQTLGREIKKLANDGIRLDEIEEGGSDGVLKLNDRFCVPDVDGLRKDMMEEAHSLRPIDKVRAFPTRKDDRFRRAAFQKRLGTNVKVSVAFYPQTDGQAERTIQTLKDMLRACVIDFGGNWDDHLPLIEFPYNNNYQSSIGMAPYEALYGRRCWSSVGWFEAAEVPMIGPEFVCNP